MTDREKVINQIDVDIQRAERTGEMLVYVGLKTAKAVLALLEEQEAKSVGKEWNECPSCGKALDRIHDMHYCGVCGQAVKWDD